MNSETNNTEILTNLGLTLNHTGSPLRRNNSLLNRPEVKSPVKEHIYFLISIYSLKCFLKLFQESTPVDITNVSNNLKSKKISPSPLKFGFIGLGNIGSGIVKNLLGSGHKVIVWNRSPDKVIYFYHT